MRADLQTATVDGRAVQYLDTGPTDGDRVLVLVHAFPLGVGMWDSQLHAFPGWRVIAPALPGFDGSDLLPDPSMDGYSRQVVALLDRLGIARAMFCGLSMGGYVMYGALRHAAARVSGVVLADTRSGGDTAEARAGREQMLEVLRREGAARVAADLLPKLLGRTTLAQRSDIVERVRRLIQEQTTESIAAATRAMMARPDSRELVAGVRIPALVVVGEEDILTPLAEAQQIHAAIPRSALAIVPLAGHLSNMENPHAFNDAVRTFLEAEAP